MITEVRQNAKGEDVEVRWPEVGEEFVDDLGRALTVTEVEPTRMHRPIVGTVRGGPMGDETREYSTDQKTFDGVWRPV